MSITVMLLAATDTALAIGTEFSAIVNVAADVEPFSITIFVTTAVVPAGAVYKVVLVDVVAAPLKRTLLVVAINYYPFD